MRFLSTLFDRAKRDAADRSFDPDIVITSAEQHAEACTTGARLVEPHIMLDDRPFNRSPKLENDLVAGIRLLNAVTTFAPDNWAAFWLKGKGYQALGNAAAANGEFRRAFDIARHVPDVAREFTISCLDLGLVDDGILAAQHAVALAPDDAGLYANLAVAFLIAGRLPDAWNAIEQALEMKPDDPISQAVLNVIDDVTDGRRPPPQRTADLSAKI